jgi:hypothetical protein
MLRRVPSISAQLLATSALTLSSSSAVAGRRFAAGDELSAEVHDAEGDETSPSVDVAEEDFEDEEPEEIDLVEAALQEAHDVVVAMQHAAGLRRIGQVIPPKEGLAAGAAFTELAGSLEQLLTPEVLQAMVKSAGNSDRVASDASSVKNRKQRRPAGDDLDHYRRRLLRDVARTHQHAPFEILNSRSNLPEYVPRFCRAERDVGTLEGLLQVTGPMPHAFNCASTIKIAKRLEVLELQ